MQVILPNLPEGLTSLDITNNEITEILDTQLPSSLKDFKSDVEVTETVETDTETENTEDENPNTIDNIMSYLIVSFVALGMIIGLSFAIRKRLS